MEIVFRNFYVILISNYTRELLNFHLFLKQSL